ncbi:hypothetical protein RF11_01079 [Thelohanellus kitauei]|uniref:Tc1-like transposase DDE domain-containing protein n=1 Tax=Thelohanellus kitauei TaxID=669202 RepID=A0A0C2ITH7_THEKT|nr:hypothetical protein RF11_01079 [Thelohanellus kitauei]
MNNENSQKNTLTRTKYSKIGEEKRRLIINAIDNLGKTTKEVAQLYDVKVSTVSTIKSQFYKTGNVNIKKKGGNRRSILNDEQKNAVLTWVDEDCLLSLSEIQAKCYTDFGLKISTSTLSRILKGFHFTIKIISVHPERRNDTITISKRKQYANGFLNLMNLNQKIFFLGECRFRCSTRKKGRSQAGTKEAVTVPNIQSKNYSISAALSANSLFFYHIKEVTCNTEVFSFFIDDFLAKLKQSGISNTVLVIDKLDFRKNRRIGRKVESHGHITLFLPPYSSFLNPIKNVFNQWKCHVTSSRPENETTLVHSINESMKFITPGDCIRYYNHMESYISRCKREEEIID